MAASVTERGRRGEAEGSQAVTGVGELPEPGRALMTERRGPLCVFGRERGVAPRSLLEKCGVNRPGVST